MSPWSQLIAVSRVNLSCARERERETGAWARRRAKAVARFTERSANGFVRAHCAMVATGAEPKSGKKKRGAIGGIDGSARAN
eukprot:6190016-Pleurochrysis_carterae.AAC.1